MYREYQSLLNRFLLFEKNESLLDARYNNIYFWRLIRNLLYERLSNQYDYHNNSFPTDKRRWIRILMDTFRYSKNIKKIQLKDESSLVITSSRYKIVGLEYQDLFLQEEIDKESSIVIHPAQPNGAHFFHDENKIIIEDFYFFFWRSIFHIKKKLGFRKIDIFAQLESNFNNYFNIESNLSSMIQNQLSLFKFDYKIYNRILKITNPNKIILTDHYSIPISLVAIANERKINVTEYQHGLIHDAHLAYNFPERLFVPYYPNEIILFGVFWKTQFHYPESTIIRLETNSYFEKRINLIKESRTQLIYDLLAISNDYVFNKLIIEFADSNPKTQILMKLHPSTLGFLDSNGTHYSKQPNRTNLTIIYDEQDLYDCLAQCRIVVGTNSTGIFEAIACGKRTFVLNPDSQPKVFNDLIQEGYLKGIFELDELLLVHPEPISKDCSIFFG